MDNVIVRLKEHQLPTSSKWRERAERKHQNKSWLRHSQRIAVKMLEKMDELGMTQKQLAEQMGCSQQYVSNVLKGQEILLECLSFM
ncbi:MAG: helix-turn-helix transcriptional regulator [Prevotella sp.]|nr:helix-turn-helix transcriptional regulator [Prevotella sp.]